MEKRKRAIANIGTDIPMQRFELFKSAFHWINYAIVSGFYLEAITLTESVLSDRIESRLTRLDVKRSSFEPLGILISELRKNEINEDLRNLINELHSWKNLRNEAIHEMVKIEKDKSFATWNSRVSRNKLIAQNGYKLLRKFDTCLAKVKKAEIKKHKLEMETESESKNKY